MRTALAMLPVPVRPTPAKGTLGMAGLQVLYVPGRASGFWPLGDGLFTLWTIYALDSRRLPTTALPCSYGSSRAIGLVRQTFLRKGPYRQTPRAAIAWGAKGGTI